MANAKKYTLKAVDVHTGSKTKHYNDIYKAREWAEQQLGQSWIAVNPHTVQDGSRLVTLVMTGLTYEELLEQELPERKVGKKKSNAMVRVELHDIIQNYLEGTYILDLIDDLQDKFVIYKKQANSQSDES